MFLPRHAKRSSPSQGGARFSFGQGRHDIIDLNSNTIDHSNQIDGSDGLQIDLQSLSAAVNTVSTPTIRLKNNPADLHHHRSQTAFHFTPNPLLHPPQASLYAATTTRATRRSPSILFPTRPHHRPAAAIQ